jgi:hypothetical protein
VVGGCLWETGGDPLPLCETHRPHLASQFSRKGLSSRDVWPTCLCLGHWSHWPGRFMRRLARQTGCFADKVHASLLSTSGSTCCYCCVRRPCPPPQSSLLLDFFFTLVTGPRRSLSHKLSDTPVYEPSIRARLGNYKPLYCLHQGALARRGVLPCPHGAATLFERVDLDFPIFRSLSLYCLHQGAHAAVTAPAVHVNCGASCGVCHIRWIADC